MIKDIIILFLVLAGSFFFLVGTIGLMRMPDAFSRMHATTKSDTLGAGLALLALMVYRGLDVVSLKLLLVIVFILITNPVAAHIISKATYYRDKVRRGEDEHANS